MVLLDSQNIEVRKENKVMFNKPLDEDKAYGYNALAFALVLAISPLSGVLGTEAILQCMLVS